MASENTNEKQRKLSKNGKPLGRPTYASQGRKKKSETQTRFPIDVPNGDVSVIEWFNIQDDPSVSIRLIIKDFIQRKGMIDAACVPVDYSPVGRKASVLKEQSEKTDVSETEEKTFGSNEVREEVKSEVRRPVITDDDDDDDMSSIFNARR